MTRAVELTFEDGFLYYFGRTFSSKRLTDGKDRLIIESSRLWKSYFATIAATEVCFVAEQVTQKW